MAQFWDGRAATLAAQAKGPILNPIEMGMPDEKSVIEKLNSISEYKELFDKAFPGSKEKITYDNLANAIAAFERTLKTNDRLDDFLKGNDKALTDAELKGLEIFLNKGCVSCHNGPLLGGDKYMKLGLVNPYENQKDLGRFEVTKKEEDKMVFKVPSLRNIALTAPYFHDGSKATLKETVKAMGKLQLGVDIPENEVDSIVAFLNTLSDKSITKK